MSRLGHVLWYEERPIASILTFALTHDERVHPNVIRWVRKVSHGPQLHSRPLQDPKAYDKKYLVPCLESTVLPTQCGAPFSICEDY